MSETQHPIRISAFASGKGSNLEAILRNINNGSLNAKVVAVISNKSQAGALINAQNSNIPAYHVSSLLFDSNKEFVNKLLDILKEHKTEIIVLAGYMKKIPMDIVRAYKHRILNIHPALLPSFGGKGLYGQFVHQAVLDYGCKVSGATVHLVDEEYDTGAPIVQQCVPVEEGDTSESLAERVLKTEHIIFSQAIQLFAENRIQISGRKLTILPSHQ
jgi:phosphoribosylglycinamide formyltransferase 1